MVEMLTKISTLLISSFIGGFLSFIIFFTGTDKTALVVDDAISISNTFIVFTTFLFVGFTIIITLFGFYLGQTYTKNKIDELKVLSKELLEYVKTNEDHISDNIINEILSSPDSERYIQEVAERQVEIAINKRHTNIKDLAQEKHKFEGIES
jgi:hypothetical protein